MLTYDRCVDIARRFLCAARYYRLAGDAPRALVYLQLAASHRRLAKERAR